MLSAIRLRPCLVDDLQLGELGETFLGEFGADARGAMSRCLLIHTVPASIWLATLWARAVSDDQTEAPRP